MDIWRKEIEEFVRAYEDRFATCDLVLNLGCGKTKFEWVGELTNYITVDPDPSVKADRVVSIYSIVEEFEDKADAIILTEVLEHVANPAKTIEDIFLMLKKGGFALMTSPFFWPIHGNGYKDFWRITEDGWHVLLSGHEYVLSPVLYPEAMLPFLSRVCGEAEQVPTKSITSGVKRQLLALDEDTLLSKVPLGYLVYAE